MVRNMHILFYEQAIYGKGTEKELLDGKQVKLATIVEGDPKVPFSIATTLRCRGGHYSFP